MRKVIGVISDDINRSSEKLKDIVKSMNEKIISEKANKIITENCIFYACVSSINTRSLRTHEMYVHKEIEFDSDVFRHVILPHLAPFNGFNSDYKWREHVHYFE